MGKKLNPDARPAEKLLSMYTYLLVNKREVSLSALANELEISKQTVLRLLKQLEASRFGKLIQTKKGRESFYQLDKPKDMPKLTLDADGLNQLVMCRNFMLHLLPKSTKDKIDTTIKQASAYTNSNDEENNFSIDGYGKSITKGSIDYTNFQEQLDVLTKCIQKDCVCSIVYKKSIFEEPKEHDFAPKRIVTYNHTISVQGLLVNNMGKAVAKHESISQLPLHRIQKAEITRRSSAHLAMPEVKNEDLFGYMDTKNSTESIKVEVEFAKGAANYVSERIWSKDQEIKVIHDKKTNDSKLILSMSVRNSKEFIAWVLGFGEKAKILSPQNLVEEMKEMLTQINKNY